MERSEEHARSICSRHSMACCQAAAVAAERIAGWYTTGFATLVPRSGWNWLAAATARRPLACHASRRAYRTILQREGRRELRMSMFIRHT